MENFKESGRFWLPTDPENRVAGEVVFDIRDGVSLSLSFDQGASIWPKDASLILGVTGTGSVTLLDAFQKHRKMSFAHGVENQVFHANQLLIGHSFDRQENLRFTSAEVSYYGLTEWVDRSGVTENVDVHEDGRHNSATLQYDQPEGMCARFSEGVVSIRFQWGLTSGVEKSALTHFVSVHLQYDDALGYQEILAHISDIQRFITFCTDTAVTTKRVEFYRHDISRRMLDGSARGQQPIEYRASPITSPTFVAKSKPRYQLNLGYDAVGGVETIAKWIQIATEYRPVLNLIATVRSERELYAENLFLNVASAAEAFHRLRYGGTQIPTQDYEELSRRIKSVTPDQYLEWMSEKLKYMNDPTLRKRIQRLGTETEQITKSLTGKVNEWASTIASVRNELTHLNKSEINAFSGRVLRWLGESVYAVVRVCLLKECVADDGIFDRLATSQDTSALEAFVRTSLTEVREIIRERRASRQNG